MDHRGWIKRRGVRVSFILNPNTVHQLKLFSNDAIFKIIEEVPKPTGGYTPKKFRKK
jgi:hypothetical protein